MANLSFRNLSEFFQDSTFFHNKMASPEQSAAFREMSKQSTFDQMCVFLRAFFRDDDVDVEDVYLMANYFHFKTGGDSAASNELELNQISELFTRLGYTMSPIEIKKTLREFDVDTNGTMNFLEFALFFWKKTVDAMLSADCDGDPALLEDLKKAKTRQTELDGAKEDCFKRIEALQEVIAKGGVKKFSATQDIEKIETDEIPEIDRQILDHNRALVHAQKAVNEAGSDLDKLLEERKFNEFSSSAQTQLHKKYEKLEPYF